MPFLSADVQGEEEMRRRFALLLSSSAQTLGVARVMQEELEGVMRDSRPLVPVVTGNLRASGMVDPLQVRGDEITGTCGYGGGAIRYARRVHENPRAGKTGGVSPSGKRYYARPGLPVPYSTVGQWKYLEQPFLARRAQMLARIAEQVNRGLEQLATR